MTWALAFRNNGLWFQFLFPQRNWDFQDRENHPFSSLSSPSACPGTFSVTCYCRGFCTLVTAAPFMAHHSSLQTASVTSFTPNTNTQHSNSDVTFQILTLKYHNSVSLTTTRMSEPSNKVSQNTPDISVWKHQLTGREWDRKAHTVSWLKIPAEQNKEKQKYSS